MQVLERGIYHQFCLRSWGKKQKKCNQFRLINLILLKDDKQCNIYVSQTDKLNTIYHELSSFITSYIETMPKLPMNDVDVGEKIKKYKKKWMDQSYRVVTIIMVIFKFCIRNMVSQYALPGCIVVSYFLYKLDNFIQIVYILISLL